MKTRFASAALCCMLILTSACKHDVDETIDCVKEEILAKLERNFDTTNPRTVHFDLEYTGTKTITSINWNFGDGSSETDTNQSTSHTFSDTGTYMVKAAVNLQNGSDVCSLTKEKNIRIKH